MNDITKSIAHFSTNGMNMKYSSYPISMFLFTSELKRVLDTYDTNHAPKPKQFNHSIKLILADDKLYSFTHSIPNSGLDYFDVDWKGNSVCKVVSPFFYKDVEVYDQCVIIDDPNLNVQICEIESI